MMENKNTIVAIVLSSLVMILWQYFYEMPRVKKLQQAREEQIQMKEEDIKQQLQHTPAKLYSKKEVVDSTTNIRIPIVGTEIYGSLSLRGARIDDINFTKYKETTDTNADHVSFLSPPNTTESYYTRFGWVTSDKNHQMPDNRTVWTTDQPMLKEGQSVTLTWDNKQCLQFTRVISLQKNYIFNIKDSVTNNCDSSLVLSNFAVIDRTMDVTPKDTFALLHEGPIGVFNDLLTETGYNDLMNEQTQRFSQNHNGWVGITDKYWLTAIIPDQNVPFEAKFEYREVLERHNFKVSYIGHKFSLPEGQTLSTTHNLFAGPKEVNILDEHQTTYNAPKFDHAVDFGWFYILTKPLFKILQYINMLLGNFGLSILAVTLIIKMLFYKLTVKSYTSIYKIKRIQPSIERLKKKYADDKIQFNKELMKLYQTEKVNPLSGCFVMLIQAPVFFALYKILFVTIEMRHAEFYGWIRDLSAPDPTSLLHLFGLLDYNLPSALYIGVWPIIMAITMFLQQRMNPAPADPVQAKIMKMLPLIFLFMFKSFPAGLVIYWSFSNILTIAQQWYIQRRLSGSREYDHLS